MPDIQHDFPIHAQANEVFVALTSPRGLESWWALEASGEPVRGSTYRFDFGPEYHWRAVVRSVEPGRSLEWEFTEADQDWTGTRVGFTLAENEGSTTVHFHHTGWASASDHFRTSSFCWAMYLRCLRRYVERGEVVPYDERFDA